MRAYLLVKFKTDADLSQAQHALGEAGVSSVDLMLDALQETLAGRLSPGPADALVPAVVD